MNKRILIVDDDTNLLASMKRFLYEKFDVSTATSGQKGLEAITREDPFAVIVSDLRMPGMDGIEFLSRSKEEAPDSVRILLTGYADLTNAARAVNKGNIFRFLTKPCDTGTIVEALQAGIEQNRLVLAERELLEKTLSGSLSVMSQFFSVVSPTTHSRSVRIKNLAEAIGREAGYSPMWELNAAAMLCQVGCVIMPPEHLSRYNRGEILTPEEIALFERHPALGAELLAGIPRLEGVSEIVAYQEKYYDGSGIPKDDRQGEDIPLGARILKVALDFDRLESAGNTPVESLEVMMGREHLYDRQVIQLLEKAFKHTAKQTKQNLIVHELRPGMILEEDLLALNGSIIAPKSTVLTSRNLAQIRAFTSRVGAQEPIKVILPE